MSNPEIAKSIKTGSYNTNYHDLGEGEVILFIHGSGPGVSAYANWRLAMPVLAEKFRVIAPDMVGFGYSDRPEDITYSMDIWVEQAIDLMDALNIKKFNIVGNSFGGGLAIS
ncbi:alpha/beta fold hydrolase, partial [Poseidonibacter sp.]|uniref:alpha/beta fold hydrolase n=1 Tax=Poseidonibacter sp. TaxID=2321188 RepID=UPI003C735412